MRTALLLVSLLLITPLTAQNFLSDGAAKNNFSGVIKSGGSYMYESENILYSSIELEASGYKRSWSYLAHGTVTLYYGEAYEGYYRDWDISRLYIRNDFEDVGIVTAGKSYINQGVSGVFNPFAFNSSINLSDPGAERDGKPSLNWIIPIGELSEAELYGAYDEIRRSYMYGSELLFYFEILECGAVINRVEKAYSEYIYLDESALNKAGFFIKGDLDVGYNAAYMLVSEDGEKRLFHEGAAGLDYSFFQKFYIDLSYRYNSRAVSDYTIPQLMTSFPARHYGYASLLYKLDEIYQGGLRGFYNAVDPSAFIFPFAETVVSDGLRLTVMVPICIGDKNSEYSSAKFGTIGVSLLFEGKF